MSKTAKIVPVDPDSELGRLLDDVAETDVLLEKDGVHYRVNRIDATSEARGAHRRRQQLDPERILDIIGIGESPEGSNVARFKDQYIADAVDHRGA